MPTPKASAAGPDFAKVGRSSTGISLQTAVALAERAMLPTPRAEDSQCAGGHRGKDDTLYGAVCRPKQIPTPTAACASGGQTSRSGKRKGELLLAGFARTFPTPSSTDGKRGGVMTEAMSGQSLTQVVNTLERFPTPTASMQTEADMEQARFSGNGGSRPDYQDAKMLPTPKSRDWKGQSQRGIHAPGDALPNMDCGDGTPVGGSLNPTWVEWLMGWIPDFTALEPIDRVMFILWKGMSNDRLGRAQAREENVRGGCLRCVWERDQVEPTPCGPESVQQQPGERSGSVYALPCESAHEDGNPSECQNASVCRLWQRVSSEAVSEREGVLGRVQVEVRYGRCEQEMVESSEGDAVCLLRKVIHQKEGKGQDVLSFLWRQASLGNSWWQVEPPIPRTSTGTPNRVNRLKCIGNGQVPQALALAWDAMEGERWASAAQNPLRKD